MRHWFAGCGAVIASALCLAAQIPPAGEPPSPVLLNAGAPMRIDFTCTDQDIAAGGLDCSAEKPCPVYLELSAIEAAGDRLLTAGNIHTGSATIGSVLLASQDAGKTWREPFERIRGANLDHLVFFDGETAWAGGQLVQPLPRDPFLLMTSDGGLTWRRRPVFSESRSGAIDRLRFDSRTGGALWIDRTQSGEPGARFEHWETTTGGDAWTLREATARPPADAPLTREVDWRLRADPATRAYHLERRSGAAWTPVAAFLIRVGECGVALKPIPEPPPDPAPQARTER